MDDYVTLIMLINFLVQTWKNQLPKMPGNYQFPAAEERILSPPAAVQATPRLSERQLKALKCRCCGLDRTDSRLLERLKKLQSFGSKALTVTSGTRCAAHNFAVGGTPRSLHLQGKAVDVSVPAAEQDLLCRQARAAGFRVILPDPQKGYVHLSL